MGSTNEIILNISGGGTGYEQTLGSDLLYGYDSIVTLDFAAQTAAPGKALTRSILLVGLRVVLTLVLEGLAFFLFGFRKKRSWMVLLIMNLLTQGYLNIALNADWPLAIYVMTDLILIEILIFIVEIIGSLTLIKEHGKGRRIAFALVANLLSLVLGGYLITQLPE